MTTEPRTRQSLLAHPWTPLALPLLAALAFIAAMWMWPWPPVDTDARRLCDQTVASLLHSKDLVEVQRAGIIIREIPCSIGWRIRDDEKAHL